MIQPDLPYIFPNRDYTHHTDLWLFGLKAMGGEAEKCYIHKIVYCKDRKTPFHEFLLMDIVHSFSGQASRALTERAPEKSDDFSAMRSISPLICGSVAANDTVRLYGDQDTSKLRACSKLAELIFEPNKLQLLNFATLLTVVSKHAPNYDVWEYQCYWYADTIYQSAKTLFEPSTERVELALSKHRRKCFLGLPLRKDSVWAILEQYGVAMEDDQKERIRKEKMHLAEERKIEQRGREMERREREMKEKAEQEEYERQMKALHRERLEMQEALRLFQESKRVTLKSVTLKLG